MPQLIIGNRNYSSWSLRAWLVLVHSGIEFTTRRIAFDSDEFRQQIATLSSNRKVPALHHHGLIISESLAIAEYVAELAPTAALWPRERPARAVARAAASEMHAGFAALRAELPMNCRASGRRVAASTALTADIARVAELWSELRARFGAGGRWLLGEWSIADAMFAPVASRFATYGIAPAGAAGDYLATALADPHLEAWYALARAETEIVEHEEVGDI